MEDTAVLIQRVREGDTKAREELISENLGLVHHVMRRFASRGDVREDLFQVGVIGLIKAVDRFDLREGTMFSTYAVPMILGEIRRFLREDEPIKLSRSLQENGRKLQKARGGLWLTLGREPRLSEMACACGLTMEEAIMAMEAQAGVVSLEGSSCQAGEEGIPLMERIAAKAQGTAGEQGGADEEKEQATLRIMVEQLLGELKGEERELLLRRYFREETQAQVAKNMGISQVQVSRRERKILEKLRSLINS
ncbi:MAG: sigma-70 family RNA polymerase sigma factor [Lachnospiraceae bacterium]|nr:sigma-70 family RNA polymerase sigma factor [Lachnospiraceae bacterium]